MPIVRVPPDFLANVVAPLRESQNRPGQLFLPAGQSPHPGHCVVKPSLSMPISGARFCNPPTSKPLDFALRRGDAHAPAKLLEEIGGFAALVNCLADDLSTRPSHRAARPSHRALPRRCGMLGPRQ